MFAKEEKIEKSTEKEKTHTKVFPLYSLYICLEVCVGLCLMTQLLKLLKVSVCLYTLCYANIYPKSVAGLLLKLKCNCESTRLFVNCTACTNQVNFLCVFSSVRLEIVLT